MAEFFVEGEGRDANDVPYCGDSFIVEASSEEGVIIKFKSVVLNSRDWFYKVTRV